MSVKQPVLSPMSWESWPGAPLARPQRRRTAKTEEPTVPMPALPAAATSNLALEDTTIRRATLSGYNPYDRQSPSPNGTRRQGG